MGKAGCGCSLLVSEADGELGYRGDFRSTACHAGWNPRPSITLLHRSLGAGTGETALDIVFAEYVCAHGLDS